MVSFSVDSLMILASMSLLFTGIGGILFTILPNSTLVFVVLAFFGTVFLLISYVFHIRRVGIIKYLPESVQSFLLETTWFDLLTDHTFFDNMKHILPFFLPLSPSQSKERLRVLPKSMRHSLRRGIIYSFPTLRSLLLPQNLTTPLNHRVKNRSHFTHSCSTDPIIEFPNLEAEEPKKTEEIEEIEEIEETKRDEGMTEVFSDSEDIIEDSSGTYSAEDPALDPPLSENCSIVHKRIPSTLSLLFPSMSPQQLIPTTEMWSIAHGFVLLSLMVSSQNARGVVFKTLTIYVLLVSAGCTSALYSLVTSFPDSPAKGPLSSAFRRIAHIQQIGTQLTRYLSHRNHLTLNHIAHFLLANDSTRQRLLQDIAIRTNRVSPQNPQKSFMSAAIALGAVYFLWRRARP